MFNLKLEDTHNDLCIDIHGVKQWRETAYQVNRNDLIYLYIYLKLF